MPRYMPDLKSLTRVTGKIKNPQNANASASEDFGSNYLICLTEY